MKESRTVFKNFSSSFIGTMIGNFFGFALLIYLPNIIGVEKYGIYNFSISYNMYFTMLTDLGIGIYSIKYINNTKDVKDYINKVFSIKILLGVISLILSVLILYILGVDGEKFKFTLIVNISIIATAICIDYFFNALNEMQYSALYTAFRNLIIFLLSIIWVKGEGDLYNVAIIYTVALFISSALLLYIFKQKHFKINIVKVKTSDFKLIKATIPLAISLIMIQINNNFDIIYLSMVKGDKAVGIYSAAYKIINFLIAILVVYFNSAYPTIARLYSEDKILLSQMINKFFRYGLIIVLPITVGGALVSEKLINFIYKIKYADASAVFTVLIFLMLIRFVASTYGAVLLMGSQAKNYTVTVIIGATLNIILNLILAPKFSYIGCSFATVISETIQIFLFYYFCKKEVKY